jgi:plastocyanin
MTWRLLIPVCALAWACLPRVGDRLDAGSAGPTLDGSVPATCANSTRDGTETDIDCGGLCLPCSLNLACAGPRDCDSGVCGTQRCALPADPCPANFSGCTGWVDLTQATSPTVTFPGSGERYAPSCVRIRLGQTVTFQGGAFGSHPLLQACGPVQNVLPSTSSGSSLMVTFDRALGTFGYYCQQHGSSAGGGMAGAIDVVR